MRSKPYWSSSEAKVAKVIAVFIGGGTVPSSEECDIVMTMDPQITRPTLVIAFGGLIQTDGGAPEGLADSLIDQFTPDLRDLDFFYTCTIIRGLLLVKIIAPRSSGGTAHALLEQTQLEEICLN